MARVKQTARVAHTTNHNRGKTIRFQQIGRKQVPYVSPLIHSFDSPIIMHPTPPPTIASALPTGDLQDENRSVYSPGEISPIPARRGKHPDYEAFLLNKYANESKSKSKEKKPRAPRKTAEEKAAEAQEKERKAQAKALEKERKAQEKAAEAQAKAQEKERKAQAKAREKLLKRISKYGGKSVRCNNSSNGKTRRTHRKK